MADPILVEARSLKLQEVAAEPTVAAEPALSLTASDGVGLLLVSLSARVVVEDPLAFTELHLIFQNPEPRQLEGRFRIALPANASVSRFAMRLGGHWQEGEVVERQAARRAYEDFLHRRQDPALLEHEAGNEFSARVFPIEASGRKELVVSYSHELRDPGEPYRLPLVGLPEIAELSIRALVGRAGGARAAVSSLGGTTSRWEVVEVEKRRFCPDRDFTITPSPSGRAGLRCDELVVARLRPPLPTQPDEIRSLLLLVDTSASRALGYARQVQIVRELARGLGRGDQPGCPLAVAGFDQGVELLFEGAARDFGDADAARLAARQPLGASDLAGALAWAAARQGASYERVLLVTDGVATAGETESDRIAAAAKALAAAGAQRLDVLAVGGLRDDGALRRLVTVGLPRDGTVCDGDLPLGEIAGKLVRATRSGIAVSVPGASWVWPARLDGVQPGDSVLVYAEVPAGQPVRVLLDQQPATDGELTFDPVARPLLERAWIRGRLERLDDLRARPDTDPDVRAGLQKQIIDLSIKHRVLSPYTALLVLETEADYERFHIDRHALADILTVGLSGVEVMQRSAARAPTFDRAPPPPPPPAAKRAARPAPPSMGGARGEAREVGSARLEERLESPLGDLATEAGMDRGAASMAPLDEMLSARTADVTAVDSEAEERQTLGFAADGDPAGAVTAAFAPPPPSAAPAPMAMMMGAASPAPVAGQAAPAAPSALRRLAQVVSGAVSDLVGRGQPPAEPPGPPRAPEPTPSPAEPESPMLDSWSGRFREVMALLLEGRHKEALALAFSWREEAPGDVLALVAIGEAAEIRGDDALAARAYGSIVDLFPSRADLRRFAGQRLSRVARHGALELAIDTYRKAVASRPDHPSGHRLLGMALLRAGRPEEAFAAIAVGLGRSYPPRFPGVPRILAEDLGLCAAAWIRAEPHRREEILDRLSRAGATLEDEPSVRFVLVWETDANDVDFHIHDARGGHAYYGQKILPSGGELYADVTQGYGPECFTIRGAPKARAYPYKLQAHYYRQGPMGYGMGALQTLEHDGQGGFAWAERPYVVMRDGAYVDLGVVKGPLPIQAR